MVPWFMPVQLHSGSILSICFRLYDTKASFRNESLLGPEGGPVELSIPFFFSSRGIMRMLHGVPEIEMTED